MLPLWGRAVSSGARSRASGLAITHLAVHGERLKIGVCLIDAFRGMLHSTRRGPDMTPFPSGPLSAVRVVF